MNIKTTPPLHASQVKSRDVSIETLRIVSMFLVLMIHYVPERRQATTETIGHFCLDELFTITLRAISIICVNCFVLISGYFGIRWKWRSFCNLLFQIIFWYVVAAVFAMCVTEVTLPTAALSVVSNLFSRWFVVAYIGLYMMSPILNSFIEKCDEWSLLLMLAAFYTYSTIFGYLGRDATMNEGMSCISLIGLYLVGAYIRKASWVQRFKPKHYMYAFIVCVLTLTIGSVLLLLFGISKSPMGYLNPIVITESAMLFLFFRTVKMKEHSWLFFVSSSVFATYLFHTQSMVYPLFTQTCTNIVDAFHPISSFFLALTFLFAVLVVTVVADKLRMAVWQRISKIPTRFHESLNSNS